MSDIRSSWEIAQDRIRAAGDLTAEERKKQQEERFRALGRGIAEKYMNTGNTAILDEELRKHGEKDREHLRKAALEHLVHTLDIRNSSVPHKFSAGITQLGAKPEAEALMQKVHSCIESYREMEKVQMHRIEDEGRGMLGRRGVTGSAIGAFNLHTCAEWQDSLFKKTSACREELEKLKRKLAAL